MLIHISFPKSIHFLSYIPRGITSQPISVETVAVDGKHARPATNLLLISLPSFSSFLLVSYFTMARCILRRGVLGLLACGALFLFSSYRLPSAADEQILPSEQIYKEEPIDHLSHDDVEPPQVAWIMSFGGLVSSIQSKRSSSATLLLH